MINLNNLAENKEILDNKIIIIGNRSDTYLTPISNNLSRAEIHALSTLTILNNNYFVQSSKFKNLLLLLFLFILGGVLGFIPNNRLSILCLSLAFVIYILGNLIVWEVFNYWILLINPLLSILLSFSLTRYFFVSSKQQEFYYLKKNLQKYVSPQIFEELIKKNNFKKAIKNERRTVTVIFADIADFTQMSERLPTDDVVNILNYFLSQMTNIIFSNKGNIDKYTGDGVMAVFGNVGKEDIQINAKRAIKSVIEMKNKINEMQEKWLSEGFMPLQIRIGVNTGDVVSGYIGSPQQKEFTVIGDAVNVAARLENLNKKLNTITLISKNTFNYVKEDVKVNNLGFYELKGKSRKVEVFELIDWKEK